MLNPTFAYYTNHFYAVGNTPALSLTRALPQGQDADILLLGCGDVRNILFTTYMEEGLPARKLDFTCCDFDDNVLARNILLFSALLDGKVEAENLWNLYYHLYLNSACLDILGEQLDKLISAAESLTAWRDGKYGKKLKFCDAATLENVASVWKKYKFGTESRHEPSYVQGLESNIKKSLELFEARHGKSSVMLTGSRSASPCSLVASNSVEELSQEFKEFWKNGTVGAVPAGTTLANPMFAGSMSEHVRLHYATDPVLGFHLAPAYAPLTSLSPLRPDGVDKEKMVAVAEAKTQFKLWAASFRALAKNITLRFVVSDALSFAHTLQHSAISKTANLFRRQFCSQILSLSEEYAAGKAPRMFDMIDSSNLADHIGALNILVAASPLLKDRPSATLNTELLIKRGKNQKEAFQSILCGHAPTISLLLGVSPVEYWTNATAVSSVDEIMSDMVRGVRKKVGGSGGGEQLHSRLSWKRNSAFAGMTETRLNIEPKALANVIYGIHKEMFDGENVLDKLKLPVSEMITVMQRNVYSHFSRTSLAALLKLISKRVECDMKTMLVELDNLVKEEASNPVNGVGLHVQEMALQLYLQGVGTIPWLESTQPIPALGTIHAWKNTPLVTAVTLVVPREKFTSLYEGPVTAKMNSPQLEGFIESAPKLTGQSLNVFTDAHIVFGMVRTSGPRDKESFRVTVETRGNDPWPRDDSPLVVSFYVPTAALQVDPKDMNIGISVAPSLQSSMLYREKLGLSMRVFQTSLDDKERVYLSKYLPGQTGYPVTCAAVSMETEERARDASFTAAFTANVQGDRVGTITGRAEILSEKGKALLTEKVPIELRQPSPFIINIVFDNNKFTVPLHFSVPVNASAAKTRIARKSSFVEVIAPFGDPLTTESLADFIFPTALSKSGLPATLNVPHLNLDRLAILDVTQKNMLRWLTPLTSLQFSVRETAMRDILADAKRGISTSTRVNFKESLFTMFVLLSGLQGGQTGLFAIHHPERGGIHMLIFASAIRLDGAAGSVVIDAAVVPFTHELIESGKVESFLLVIRSLECCTINVNDEELVLWKKVLPALAERCRTWSHRPGCEYRAAGATIPLSLEHGARALCTCGHGKIPDDFVALPEWEVMAPHCARVAISPTYAMPIVEDLISETEVERASAIFQGEGSCRRCGRKEGPVVTLKKCSRCLTVKYCGAECQKKDWKKHRMECDEQ